MRVWVVQWSELQLRLDRGVPGTMSEKAHWSAFNANSYLPDFLLQLHSFTPWISGPRPPAVQYLHAPSITSEADVHLPSSHEERF